MDLRVLPVGAKMNPRSNVRFSHLFCEISLGRIPSSWTVVERAEAADPSRLGYLCTYILVEAAGLKTCHGSVSSRPNASVRLHPWGRL
jgi:hypothetical protein